MNSDREQFGDQRLNETIIRHKDDSAEAIIDAIIATVREHVGSAPQMDDITLVVVKRVE
jgi:sigma-B regulation protein RsbU (phosphoserine phosphatase)